MEIVILWMQNNPWSDSNFFILFHFNCMNHFFSLLTNCVSISYFCSSFCCLQAVHEKDSHSTPLPSCPQPLEFFWGGALKQGPCTYSTFRVIKYMNVLTYLEAQNVHEPCFTTPLFVQNFSSLFLLLMHAICHSNFLLTFCRNNFHFNLALKICC